VNAISAQPEVLEREIETTHEGLVTPMKSWLLAHESQDSTLQLPGSDTSAVSTP